MKEYYCLVSIPTPMTVEAESEQDAIQKVKDYLIANNEKLYDTAPIDIKICEVINIAE